MLDRQVTADCNWYLEAVARYLRLIGRWDSLDVRQGCEALLAI
jgi:hypothetical protein